MRKRFVLLLAALCAVATGCSLARLGGKYADWYAMKRLDDAFDLTRAQVEQARPRVKQHIAWLKQSEIPNVLRDLDQLIERVERGLKEDDAAWVESRIDALKGRLDARLRPDAVGLLSKLDPSQIAHVQRDLEDKKKDWLESFDDSPEEFRRKRYKRFEKTYREWLGSISDAQREDLHRRFAPLADRDTARALTDGRIQSFEAFIVAITPPSDAARVDAYLTDWVRDPASLRKDEAARLFRERQRLIREGLLGIGLSITTEQRAFLVEKLKDHRDDLAAFAKTE